jgi:hypothetical protein
MDWLSLTVVIIMAAGVARQAFVLSAILRSHRFLGRQHATRLPTHDAGPAPRFFIVVPVLREAGIIGEAVAHFRAVAHGHEARVVIVTTAREARESRQHPTAGDTVAMARKLAASGHCLHLHSPDPLGVKADQLNYAAGQCTRLLPPGPPAAGAFLVCYDADSRPPKDSLACFAQAIKGNPGVHVFHQSSRFEYRSPAPRPTSRLARLAVAVCDAGALRANRFVLGFEIPRLLNRSPQAGAVKRALCTGVYAHVTGHGLCIRLSLLQRLPFPARSPLEDMHYSFITGSLGLPTIAVPSLDVAEVPVTIRAQAGQAARWFFGPARFTRYLADPATASGWRSRVLAASAFGSATEWIGCAIVPALTIVLLVIGDPGVRIAAACYAVTCAIQVALTEAWLGTPTGPGARIARAAAFPLACTVHGAGGILGLARLLAGGTGAGKTERGQCS